MLVSLVQDSGHLGLSTTVNMNHFWFLFRELEPREGLEETRKKRARRQSRTSSRS